MARFPISSKDPPSPSSANDDAMKSSERLLSTVSMRVAQSSASMATAQAVASRELHDCSTSVARSCACLCGFPAVPISTLPSQCPYSTAWQPMPPTAACTSMALPACGPARCSDMCTVLHVTGTVHTCSNDSATGLRAR
eukprot:5682670-Prymnesium_polylepis.1